MATKVIVKPHGAYWAAAVKIDGAVHTSHDGNPSARFPTQEDAIVALLGVCEGVGSPLPHDLPVEVRGVTPTAPTPAPEPENAANLAVETPAYGGVMTPATAPDGWLAAYTAAVGCMSNLLPPPKGETPSDRSDRVAAFRRGVNRLMRAVGAVSPWAIGPGEQPWLLISGADDPNRFAIEPGRRRAMKDINGYAVDALNGETLPPREVKFFETFEYEGDDAALATAKAVGKAHSKGGGDRAERSLRYKMGVVASLRHQGAPAHDKYEADLREAGVSEEELAEVSVTPPPPRLSKEEARAALMAVLAQ